MLTLYDRGVIKDMKQIPLVSIGRIRDDDLVRVAGRVEPFDPVLTAPCSGRPCVLFEIKLLDRWGNRIVEEQRSSDFLLSDRTARALVRSPCRILILPERVHERGRGEDVPEILATWLKENYSSERWRDADRLTWIERRIEIGDALAVVGWAHLEKSLDDRFGGYREAPIVPVIETEADHAALTFCDLSLMEMAHSH